MNELKSKSSLVVVYLVRNVFEVLLFVVDVSVPVDERSCCR